MRSKLAMSTSHSSSEPGGLILNLQTRNLTLLFLKKNGYHFELSKKEGIMMMLEVITKEDNEEEVIKVAKILKKHSKKL